MSIRYSFVLPTFNRIDLLKWTIDSLLNQNYNNSDYEIIIIDDNSTDNTWDYINSLIKSLDVSNIIYYRNNDNKWEGFNRDKGIKLSHWDIIIETEDDAWYASNYLDAVDKEISKLSNDVWGTLIVLPRRTLNFHEWIIPKLVDYGRKSIEELTKKGKRPVIWWRIFKKNIYQKIWWYKSNLRIGTDTDLVKRFRINGYPNKAIYSTYWKHYEPNTFNKFFRRMYKQWFYYKEYKDEFKPEVSVIWKIFWIWLLIFPVFCLLSTMFFWYFGLLFMLFWFVLMSFLNQEVRWMYPLILKSKKYKYLIFFVFLYYLTSVYWILNWRIARSLVEKKFYLY